MNIDTNITYNIAVKEKKFGLFGIPRYFFQFHIARFFLFFHYYTSTHEKSSKA